MRLKNQELKKFILMAFAARTNFSFEKSKEARLRQNSFVKGLIRGYRLSN